MYIMKKQPKFTISSAIDGFQSCCMSRHAFLSLAASAEVVHVINCFPCCELFRCHSGFHKIHICNQLDIGICEDYKLRVGYCIQSLQQLVGLRECRVLSWKKHTWRFVQYEKVYASDCWIVLKYLYNSEQRSCILTMWSQFQFWFPIEESVWICWVVRRFLENHAINVVGWQFVF